MPNRFRAAAPKLLLACLILATAMPAAVHARQVPAGSYWQQVVALLARWGSVETTQNCIPSEVDSCGVQEPQ